MSDKSETQIIEDYFAEIRRDGYIVDGVGPRELAERLAVSRSVDNLPQGVGSYEYYDVYVDSGRAHDLFKAFCKTLGHAIKTNWKDTEYV